MCKSERVSYGTGKLWLRQRKKLNTLTASRRIEKNRPESSVKVTNDQLTEMLNVKKNLVRDQT